MNWNQKKFKRDILNYRETCREHYHASKERKCEGCPYEHMIEPDYSECQIIFALRKLNTQVPAYWSGTVIEDIFKE